MKATFKKDAQGYVTVSYDCVHSGERETRTFYSSGTYVRESSNRDKQVCSCLGYTGSTLMASKDSLLQTIRHEYKAMRRTEKKS